MRLTLKKGGQVTSRRSAPGTLVDLADLFADVIVDSGTIARKELLLAMTIISVAERECSKVSHEYWSGYAAAVAALEVSCRAVIDGWEKHDEEQKQPRKNMDANGPLEVARGFIPCNDPTWPGLAEISSDE